jgi:hypothetical protein
MRGPRPDDDWATVKPMTDELDLDAIRGAYRPVSAPDFEASVTRSQKKVVVVGAGAVCPSTFTQRAADARRLFTASHEFGHLALEGRVSRVAASVSAADHYSYDEYFDARVRYRMLRYYLLGDFPNRVGGRAGFRRDSTKPAAPRGESPDPSPTYADLRSAHPDFFAPVHREQTNVTPPSGEEESDTSADASLLGRSGLRLFARACTAAAGGDILVVLRRCWEIALSVAALRALVSPEPERPPGRLVTSRRRPARGPNASWSYRSPVHGAA